jgi:hypothetical protein
MKNKKVLHALFTIGNILSFTLIAYQIYLGFVIGLVAAILGIYIFRKDLWLVLTQVFYLVINTINLIL